MGAREAHDPDRGGINGAVELLVHMGPEPQPRPVDRWISRIAERQFGLITRDQLIELGVREGGIRYRLRVGRPHRLHQGVYLVGHAARTHRSLELGAVLAAGRGAVLSHASAAYFWNLFPYPAQPHDVHVTLNGRKRRRRPGLVIHSGALPRSEYCIRDGIPVTQVPRTLLDLAARAPRHELEDAVNAAHAQRRVGRAQLERMVARYPGRAGTRALIEVAGLETGGHRTTRSSAERRLLSPIGQSGLPLPETNARVAGYEVDVLWRDVGLVVEVDGWSTHGSRLAFERDRRRDARLVAAGLIVIRLTADEIAANPNAALAVVRDAWFALRPRRRAGSA